MDSHSKYGPASSLSIADLHDMVNRVHLPSSSASNTALSTISGTFPTWLLDSACCNHMTYSPDVAPSHTSTSLPTIYIANGSAMHVSHLGNVSTPALFFLMFTRFPNSLIIFFLLGNSLNLVFL